MTSLTIVGGVYAERALWPDWDQVYGSAGRAAVAVCGHVSEIDLYAYARPDVGERFAMAARHYGFCFHPVSAPQVIAFNYTHGLAVPLISPNQRQIVQNATISVSAPNILRFGMLEGDARVEAERCVYDPQDQIYPTPFDQNGSRANSLAIVANQTEVAALAGDSDWKSAAAKLLKRGAAVVVVKAGPLGAFVYTPTGVSNVPAYQTNFVWPVGSGDVFAGMFAARWAAAGDAPSLAAEIASRAVAEYVESMALPIPSVETLKGRVRSEVRTVPGKVYLASPFFSMGERWLVEEARRALRAVGLEVFSPLHEVGPGSAHDVAPLDLKAVDECDLVFAILDGLDSGTIFEVGYARKADKPVYGLALTVTEEDLKMVIGSGCKVYSDFVTAVYHTAWRA